MILFNLLRMAHGTEHSMIERVFFSGLLNISIKQHSIVEIFILAKRANTEKSHYGLEFMCTGKIVYGTSIGERVAVGNRRKETTQQFRKILETKNFWMVSISNSLNCKCVEKCKRNKRMNETANGMGVKEREMWNLLRILRNH